MGISCIDYFVATIVFYEGKAFDIHVIGRDKLKLRFQYSNGKIVQKIWSFVYKQTCMPHIV